MSENPTILDKRPPSRSRSSSRIAIPCATSAAKTLAVGPGSRSATKTKPSVCPAPNSIAWSSCRRATTTPRAEQRRVRRFGPSFSNGAAPANLTNARASSRRNDGAGRRGRPTGRRSPCSPPRNEPSHTVDQGPGSRRGACGGQIRRRARIGSMGSVGLMTVRCDWTKKSTAGPIRFL